MDVIAQDSFPSGLEPPGNSELCWSISRVSLGSELTGTNQNGEEQLYTNVWKLFFILLYFLN